VITRFLDRYPRLRYAVHGTIDRTLRLIARAGLDLNRLRVRTREAAGSRAALIRFTEMTEPCLVAVRPPAAVFDREPGRQSDLVARIVRGYSVPAGGLLEIREGRFDLPSGFVSVRGRLPSEVIPLLYFPHGFNVVPALRALYAPAQSIEDGVLINLPMSNSYFHWSCEILPRAAAAAAATAAEMPLYISEDMPPFVFESLKMLGLEDRCVRLARGVYRAPKLTVWTWERGQRPTPHGLWEVRTRLLDAAEPGSAGPRRLLISRADAVGRKILNERGLLEGLGDLGLERVTLTGTSLEDQIRMFRGAELIVAPHGAGLTNILYAPSDCRIIELVVESHNSDSYLIVSSILGQRYGYVRCREQGRDMVADVSAVRAVAAELDRTRAAASPSAGARHQRHID
jgi:hypothetical protein